jgi:hypothetical protein
MAMVEMEQYGRRWVGGAGSAAGEFCELLGVACSRRNAEAAARPFAFLFGGLRDLPDAALPSRLDLLLSALSAIASASAACSTTSSQPVVARAKRITARAASMPLPVPSEHSWLRDSGGGGGSASRLPASSVLQSPVGVQRSMSMEPRVLSSEPLIKQVAMKYATRHRLSSTVSKSPANDRWRVC